jgi:hypothetical protein
LTDSNSDEPAAKKKGQVKVLKYLDDKQAQNICKYANRRIPLIKRPNLKKKYLFIRSDSFEKSQSGPERNLQMAHRVQHGQTESDLFGTVGEVFARGQNSRSISRVEREH